MACKRQNEDNLENHGTKRFRLDKIRELLQTEKSNTISNDGSSSSNVNSNTSTVTTFNNDIIQVTEEALEMIMKFHDSLPTERKVNEDELLKMITIGLRRNAYLRESFQADETNITSMINRRIRSHGTNDGSSSSNINSNISPPANTMILKDLKLFWMELYLILREVFCLKKFKFINMVSLEEYIDVCFMKVRERLGHKFVDQVNLCFRPGKCPKESFKKERINITDIVKIISYDNSNSGISPAPADLKIFVKNVMGLFDGLKKLGFLEQSNPLSNPLSREFIKFVVKAERDLISFQ